MENPAGSSEFSEQEKAQYLNMILEIRQKAFQQIIFGLGWWVASAIAMYVAMQSTNPSIFWYGGALGALFHWYRAFKMITATQKLGAKALIQNEAILIGIVAIIVLVSGSKIIPEYFRMDSRSIGTCWAEADSNNYVPVACWSGSAAYKSSYFAYSETECGIAGYFQPSATESRYTCLEEV